LCQISLKKKTGFVLNFTLIIYLFSKSKVHVMLLQNYVGKLKKLSLLKVMLVLS